MAVRVLRTQIPVSAEDRELIETFGSKKLGFTVVYNVRVIVFFVVPVSVCLRSFRFSTQCSGLQGGLNSFCKTRRPPTSLRLKVFIYNFVRALQDFSAANAADAIMFTTPEELTGYR